MENFSILGVRGGLGGLSGLPPTQWRPLQRVLACARHEIVEMTDVADMFVEAVLADFIHGRGALSMPPRMASHF